MGVRKKHGEKCDLAVNLRRTRSTNIGVEPFAADTGLQPLFTSHGFGPCVKLLVVDEFPGSGMFGRELAAIVLRVVVLGHASGQIVRLTNIPLCGSLAYEYVNVEDRLVRHVAPK